MKDSTKKIIFYLVLFTTLYFNNLIVKYVSQLTKLKPLESKLITYVILLGLIIGIYNLLKLDQPKDGYRMFTPSMLSQCKGGLYLAQGDSAQAVACRKFLKSPEGQQQMCDRDCGVGNMGLRGGNFRYTPDSDSRWRNTRCDPDQKPTPLMYQ